MAQTENNVNTRTRIKLNTKALIIIGIFIFCIGAVVSCYCIFKDDFKTMAENAATYSGNAKISATEGIVSYKVDEDGNPTGEQMTAEDVLKGRDNIAKYLKDDTESSKEEKLAYLLNAELVTKFPYIDDLAEDKVNGIVKFYRYSEAETETEDAQDSEQEKYPLKFVNEETFDQAMEAYETSGSLEVFNYFTIDEDQQLVIACRTETQKEITTNDPEVTVEKIKEESGDNTYYSSESLKYETSQKTIIKQPKDYQSIIEPYTMPFNLLAAFLVQTGDYDFVKKLADMAYESEIHIGIYENASTTTKSDTYNYKKRIEYSPSTELDFSKVSTTNPIMKEQDIENRFPKIIRSCIANMPQEVEGETWEVTHKITTMGGDSEENADHTELYTKYVQSYSGSDISALTDSVTDGMTFTTTYSTTTESRTSLTIGTILADTWVARWEATYDKETEEPNEPPQEPTTSDPYNSARTFGGKDAINLFTGTAATEIKDILKKHSDELEDDAVNIIIKNTTVNATGPTMTAELIREHALGCDICRAELDNFYGGRLWNNPHIISNATLVNAVQNEEKLENTRKDLNAIVDEAKKQNSDDAKDKFENDLRNQITPNQYITVAKSYASINVESYSEKNSVTHKQDTDNTNRTNEGEKFIAVFNNSEYHEARQAVLDRIPWFWEYIREYDDTAKFENILKYLFNLATGTNHYGTFKDLDELFKAFEPEELKFSSTTTGLGLAKYLAQFSGDTPDTIDGVEYFDFYNDGAGNPTIGSGDVQWFSNYDKFNITGTVRQGSNIYENCNVQEKVNQLLGANGYATKWSDKYIPPESEKIYIDAETVYKVTDKIQATFWDIVIEHTEGLNLSRQQLYALTYITHATGNLVEVAQSENFSPYKSFKGVYLEAQEKGLEPDSWEFNRYIWENWWNTKWAGGYSQGREYPGWLKGRDASFETYVKGIFIFEGNSVDTHIESNGYKFYSREEVINKIGFSSSSNPARYARNRDINNEAKEEELFTYVLGTLGGTFEEASDKDIRGIYTASSGRIYTEWIQSSSTTWGTDTIKYDTSWGPMWKAGCPIYAAAILTSSEGIDVTPGKINEEYYTGNEGTTIQTILNAYNVNNKATYVYNASDYISKLQEGYGFATYVNSNSGFASSQHWIVVADIRTSELGSNYGYDVYILSSTTKGLEQTRWHPIESVIDNLQTTNGYGCYIQD